MSVDVELSSGPPPTIASAGVPNPRFGLRDALICSLEGVWGAGKTSTARAVQERLTGHGYRTAVMHYGPRSGVIAAMSALLDDDPLRSRDGIGGYRAPHLAVVDVLLRLCREADQHRRHYRPEAGQCDVLILDHGVYGKLAYALAVLTEHPPPGLAPDQLLEVLLAVVRPWFLHPHQAFFLDVPWPLARERAVGRGYGGGDAASVERLMFLPHFDAAYRRLAAILDSATTPHPAEASPAGVAPAAGITTVAAGLRPLDDVAAEIEHHLLVRLSARPAVLTLSTEEGACVR
uniref:hypothetical protein n=1 Tax=Nonomuraea sp. CA-252377 TaxID=3240003 RepID=UPI003F49A26F